MNPFGRRKNSQQPAAAAQTTSVKAPGLATQAQNQLGKIRPDKLLARTRGPWSQIKEGVRGAVEPFYDQTIEVGKQGGDEDDAKQKDGYGFGIKKEEREEYAKSFEGEKEKSKIRQAVKKYEKSPLALRNALELVFQDKNIKDDLRTFKASVGKIIKDAENDEIATKTLEGRVEELRDNKREFEIVSMKRTNAKERQLAATERWKLLWNEREELEQVCRDIQLDANVTECRVQCDPDEIQTFALGGQSIEIDLSEHRGVTQKAEWYNILKNVDVVVGKGSESAELIFIFAPSFEQTASNQIQKYQGVCQLMLANIKAEMTLKAASFWQTSQFIAAMEAVKTKEVGVDFETSQGINPLGLFWEKSEPMENSIEITSPNIRRNLQNLLHDQGQPDTILAFGQEGEKLMTESMRIGLTKNQHISLGTRKYVPSLKQFKVDLVDIADDYLLKFRAKLVTSTFLDRMGGVRPISPEDLNTKLARYDRGLKSSRLAGYVKKIDAAEDPQLRSFRLQHGIAAIENYMKDPKSINGVIDEQNIVNRVFVSGQRMKNIDLKRAFNEIMKKVMPQSSEGERKNPVYRFRINVQCAPGLEIECMGISCNASFKEIGSTQDTSTNGKSFQDFRNILFEAFNRAYRIPDKFKLRVPMSKEQPVIHRVTPNSDVKFAGDSFKASNLCFKLTTNDTESEGSKMWWDIARRKLYMEARYPTKELANWVYRNEETARTKVLKDVDELPSDKRRILQSGVNIKISLSDISSVSAGPVTGKYLSKLKLKPGLSMLTQENSNAVALESSKSPESSLRDSVGSNASFLSDVTNGIDFLPSETHFASAPESAPGLTSEPAPRPVPEPAPGPASEPAPEAAPDRTATSFTPLRANTTKAPRANNRAAKNRASLLRKALTMSSRPGVDLVE